MTSQLRTATFTAALFASGCIGTEVNDDAPAETDGDDGDVGGAADDADDDTTGATCGTSFTLAGTVSGVDAAIVTEHFATTFDNVALETAVLGEIDFEFMREMGLDPDDPDDRDRFAYFTRGADLHNEYTELLDEFYGPDGLLPKSGRDASLVFYDLAAHDVQPGTPVAVFDASSIEALRDDPDALGDQVRILIDEMRTNGQPDVLVAFAPDRSEEPIDEGLWMTTLSRNARFATAGTATFHSVVDVFGNSMVEIEYPTHDIDVLSIDAHATFAADEAFHVEATCMTVLTYT